MTTTTDQRPDIAAALATIGRRLDDMMSLRQADDIANAVWQVRDRIMEQERTRQRRRANRENVAKRLRECYRHIDRMRSERMGWGPEAEAEVTATERSLLNAIGVLMDADEVWPDGFGGDDLSFSGVMAGSITFGMVARTREPRFDAHTVKPVEWTFHS